MGGGSRVFDSEDGVGVEIYERRRHTAIENITKFLRCEVDEERRVLIGFDFAFGYPRGFAESITGKKCALEMWSALSVSHDHDDSIGIVVKDKENTSNRFDVAAALNRKIIASANDRDQGVSYGPFWGFPGGSGMDRPPFDPYRIAQRPKSKQHLPWLPWPAAGFGFKRERITDRRARGAKSVFQLNGIGSVGSQAILGMRYLHRLRCHVKQWNGMKDRCVVWPFDPWVSLEQKKESGPEIVIVEFYPSLVTRGSKAEYADREQVKENARAFGMLDARGDLRTLFDLEEILSPDEKATVEREEGWILGAGRTDILLQSVAKDDSSLRSRPKK